jgi:hypothetical protein
LHEVAVGWKGRVAVGAFVLSGGEFLVDGGGAPGVIALGDGLLIGFLRVCKSSGQ